jgi:hypothetical protein
MWIPCRSATYVKRALENCRVVWTEAVSHSHRATGLRQSNSWPIWNGLQNIYTYSVRNRPHFHFRSSHKPHLNLRFLELSFLYLRSLFSCPVSVVTSDIGIFGGRLAHVPPAAASFIYAFLNPLKHLSNIKKLCILFSHSVLVFRTH